MIPFPENIPTRFESDFMYVVSVDVGTTNLKACLFEISSSCNLVSESSAEYRLYPMADGGMEQDHDEWWHALCRATREVITKSGINPEKIAGFSICAQMLGLVLVDQDGVPVHRPMNYMDQRAHKQWKQGIRSGFRIGGYNVRKTVAALLLSKSAPLDVRDPLWRYKWVEENEPENFARVFKWVDVKDYLNGRCTGNFVATEDTAFTTMLYENAKGKKNFSARLLKMFGVRESHMPKVIGSTDLVGYLKPEAAAEMGMVAGTAVFGGGGDASCIALGSGYTKPGMTHVYIGTSSWVSTVTVKQKLDPICMIASIYGAEEGRFNFHAEMNAAGKCYEWVRDHIALDNINLYSEYSDILKETHNINIYDRLSCIAQQAGIGCGGVIFAPWLAGERCPISEENPCGMYFNLSLRTDKASLIRAVLEGICYHIRWMSEKHQKTLPVSPVLRLVGGGALSPVVCQMLADITGKTVETTPFPQNAGAVGAAIISAVGLGAIPSIDAANEYVSVSDRYEPDMQANAVYEQYYQIYKRLYSANKKLIKKIHKIKGR